VLSQGNSLEEDCGRASVLMYRGSSTALHGVLHGLLPVAVHADGAVSPDPLYWLQGWRKGCASPEEFAGVVECHARTPLAQLDAAWRSAREQVQNYLEPVTDQSIDELLSAIEQRSEILAP